MASLPSATHPFGLASLSSPVESSPTLLAEGSQSPGRKRQRRDSVSDSEAPPEKRQAIASGHGGYGLRDEVSSSEGAVVPIQRRARWKRDETYYMEDGSCVLLVEDTLFNVHRTILSKDASSFSTMFTLPQGNQEAEGRSDDNPIVLTGDKPSEFRNFLWALYALPPELRVVTSPSANLPQLIDIALIANKYSFKSIETWSLDAIQEYVNRKPSPILFSISPSTTYTFGVSSPSSSSSTAPTPAPAPAPFSPTTTTTTPSTTPETTSLLTRLIHLAQLCNHERLLSTMISLLRQLMSSSVQYAYLAMTLADELDLRSLRGAAYLEVMQKARVVAQARVDLSLKPAGGAKPPTGLSDAEAEGDAPGGSGAPPEQVELGDLDPSGRLIVTRAQQLRLLAGHYRLAGAWESLRRSPPHFEHAQSCGATWHMQGCRQSWLEFWKEKTRSDAVLALGLADVLGRLKQVQKEHDRWGSATYMHHDCRMAARRSIVEVIRKVEEGLPDFFSEAGECES